MPKKKEVLDGGRKLQQNSEKLAPRQVNEDVEEEEEQKEVEIEFCFNEAIEDILKISEDHEGEKDELRIKVGRKLEEWRDKINDEQKIMILEMIG